MRKENEETGSSKLSSREFFSHKEILTVDTFHNLKTAGQAYIEDINNSHSNSNTKQPTIGSKPPGGLISFGDTTNDLPQDKLNNYKIRLNDQLPEDYQFNEDERLSKKCSLDQYLGSLPPPPRLKNTFESGFIDHDNLILAFKNKEIDSSDDKDDRNDTGFDGIEKKMQALISDRTLETCQANNTQIVSGRGSKEQLEDNIEMNYKQNRNKINSLEQQLNLKGSELLSPLQQPIIEGKKMKKKISLSNSDDDDDDDDDDNDNDKNSSNKSSSSRSSNNNNSHYINDYFDLGAHSQNNLNPGSLCRKDGNDQAINSTKTPKSNKHNKQDGYHKKHKNTNGVTAKDKSQIPSNKHKQSSQEIKSGLSMSVNDIDLVAMSNHGNGMMIRQCSSTEEIGGLQTGKNTTAGDTLKKNLRQAMVDSALRPKSRVSKIITESCRQNSRIIPPSDSTFPNLGASNFGKKSEIGGINNSKKLLEKSKKESSKTVAKPPNLFRVVLRLKAKAVRLAWKSESRRLAMLAKQQFSYLKDLSLGFSNIYQSSKDQISNGFDDTKLQSFNPKTSKSSGLMNKSTFNSIRTQVNLLNIGVFAPQWRLKFLWDFLVSLSVGLFFFMLPLRLIYDDMLLKDHFGVNGLDIFFCIVSSLDVILTINTSQFSKGKLISDRTQLLYSLISKKEGILQLLAATAMWLCMLTDRLLYNIDSTSLSICEIILILRLLSLDSLQHALADRFHFKRVARGAVQLVQILFNLFAVSHIFASLWLLLGKHDQQLSQSDYLQCVAYNTNSGNNSSSPYSYKSYAANNTCVFSWMDKFRYTTDLYTNSDSVMYGEYLRAYYFATVTMITVGYGDFVPVNLREYLLSILTMLIACGMFGYSLSSIGQVLSEMDIHHRAFDYHFSSLNAYMYAKKIPLLLQHSAREYLQYFFIHSDFDDNTVQQKAIKLLPMQLQKQLLAHANKIVLEFSPIFKDNFSEQILEKMMEMIEEQKARPGEVILHKGQQDDQSIYFVSDGSVEVYNESSGEKLQALDRGACFGEISFFSDQPRSVSIRSVEFTSLLVIKKEHFMMLLRQSPLDLEKFVMIRDSIKYKSKYESVAVSCFCCRSTTHMVNECDFVHYQADRSKVISVHLKQANNETREAHKRREDRINSMCSLQVIQNTALMFIEDNLDILDNDTNYDVMIDQLPQQDGFVNDMPQSSRNIVTRRRRLQTKQFLSNYHGQRERQDDDVVYEVNSSPMLEHKPMNIANLAAAQQQLYQDNFNTDYQNHKNYTSLNAIVSPNNNNNNVNHQANGTQAPNSNAGFTGYFNNAASNMNNTNTNNNANNNNNSNFLRIVSIKSEEGNSNNCTNNINNNYYKEFQNLIPLSKKVQFSANSIPTFDQDEQESRNGFNSPQVTAQGINFNHISNSMLSYNINNPENNNNINAMNLSHAPGLAAHNSSANVTNGNNTPTSQLRGQSSNNTFAGGDNNPSQINILINNNNNNNNNEQSIQIVQSNIRSVSNSYFQQNNINPWQNYYKSTSITGQPQQQSQIISPTIPQSSLQMQLMQQNSNNNTNSNNNNRGIFQKQVSSLSAASARNRFGRENSGFNNGYQNQGSNAAAAAGGVLSAGLRSQNSLPRGSKRKITLKSDYQQLRQIIAPQRKTSRKATLMQFQSQQQQQQYQLNSSNTNDKEMIVRQLCEMIQLPQQNQQINIDDGMFESFKNFQIYLPNNNCERVLSAYAAIQRKKAIVIMLNRRKKSNILQDSISLRQLMVTHLSTKKSQATHSIFQRKKTENTKGEENDVQEDKLDNNDD